jgi:hypothetical protein
MGVFFILGFLVGKTVGTLVSSVPFIGLFFEDMSLGDLLVSEFFAQLLSFNGYHYALAIICGLIFAIWKTKDLFE